MTRGAPSRSVLAVIAIGAAYLQSRYSETYLRLSILQYVALNGTVLVFLRLFWTIYIWPRYWSQLRYLPQPVENRSFWNSLQMTLKEEEGLKHREWINSLPNEGLVRYLVMGGGERVFLTSPKALFEVLVARSYDYRRPPLLQDVLGRIMGDTGLILTEGDQHRMQRKNLTPAFSVRYVKDLVPTFYSIGAHLCQVITENIQQSAGGNKTDGSMEKDGIIQFHTWISRATLDIIGIAGMGVDFRAVDDPANELSVAYEQVFGLSLQEQILRVMSVFISFQWLKHLPIRRNRELTAGILKIRETARRLIKQKQQKTSEKSSSQHNDILSAVLTSSECSIENLVDQVMTFLGAGHETTATATQWAMVVLAQHPQTQERLRSEIREKLPSIDRVQHITSDTIVQLPYLKACCNEILRIHPPGPFTQRVAAVDTQIMGHYIPKGTTISIVPAAVNFSKELWGEDAESFDPERWLRPGCALSGGAESNYANMTFTAGPRGCIAATFAKYEFQCLVATIIGRFEVELYPRDSVIQSETISVTKPKGGLPLRMKVVGGW